jgi:hypothetical protein
MLTKISKKKEFKREELDIPSLFRLSSSIPVELDVPSFSWLVMGLFPDTMFHFFRDGESLLATHLTIGKKFTSTSSFALTSCIEALSEVFTECW